MGAKRNANNEHAYLRTNQTNTIMNFFIAYFKGFWLTLQKIRMWILLYLINFIFAIIVAIPLFNLIGNKTGKSLAPQRLLPDFDYTIYQDFMNEYGDAVSIIMGQSQVIFVLYFFLSIFLVGGILKIFKNNKDRFNFQAFWSGCTFYFWRMLRLTIYFLIIHGVILGIVGSLAYYSKMHAGFEALESEAEIINMIKYVLPIYLIFASFFFMVQDYAKIHVAHKDPNWLFFPFWKSFSIVFKNFSKTYPLYLLNVITFAIIFSVFWYFRLSNNMDSASSVALTFGVGQAFVFGRIGTKLINLGSATLMYQSIMKEELEKETIDDVSEESLSEGETLVFVKPEDNIKEEEE